MWFTINAKIPNLYSVFYKKITKKTSLHKARLIINKKSTKLILNNLICGQNFCRRKNVASKSWLLWNSMLVRSAMCASERERMSEGDEQSGWTLDNRRLLLCHCHSHRCIVIVAFAAVLVLACVSSLRAKYSLNACFASSTSWPTFVTVIFHRNVGIRCVAGIAVVFGVFFALHYLHN